MMLVASILGWLLLIGFVSLFVVAIWISLFDRRD